jgi:hypothetical protein
MQFMETSSPPPRTTTIRYPDKRKGPFLITGEWRWLQEQWQLVAYRQGFVSEAEVRELQTEDARALRLPVIKARSALELDRQLRAEGQDRSGVPTPPPSSREQYRRKLLRQREEAEAAQGAKRRGRGRPPVPLGELREVGRIYAEAYRTTGSPTKAVAERLNISYAAAAKRVTSCRRLGILGPAEQGKATVGQLMGTGDAASLRSLNESKKISSQRVAQLASDEAAGAPHEAPGGGEGS